jgi:light-regulated signal transduction histidine kinase (bacteriophytochrome)
MQSAIGGETRMHKAELEQVRGTVSRLRECLELVTCTVSHDLRAPLRAIDAFSRLIAEEQAHPLTAPTQCYLERIQREVKRANDMIGQVLTMACTGMIEKQISVLDLSAMAADIVSQLRAAYPARGVEVVIQDGLVACADAVLTRQLLQNLLDNAWKYTEQCRNARIEFGCERRAGNSIFFVRDNGAGFDSNVGARVFRPFERLHSGAEFQGIGLGLTSAQRVVELHGGTIWAQARPGEGACFYFTLPECSVEQ